MSRLFLFLTVLTLFFSCKKDKIGPQCISCEENPINNTSNSDVLIINEGNFGWGNSSLSVYNKSNNQVSQNVFWQQNNGLALGDVAQSMCQFNGKGYIVLNNSSKIEVVNMSNFISTATITGFNSPRFILPINNAKAYVTDLYSNSIQIVNLNTQTITGNIAVSGWTEELLIYNDTVYVCDVTNNQLLIINPQNDQLVSSIPVGENPSSLVIDKNNKIWILCDGGISSTNPQLIQYNPANRTIEQTFIFPAISQSPNHLKINAVGAVLYFLNDGVYQFNISDNNLPSSPIIPSNSTIFYGLGIDPTNNDIYVADAIDYVQNGIVFRYNAAGGLIHQFNAGIIPNGFLFIQ